MTTKHFFKKTAVAFIIAAISFTGCEEEIPKDNPDITIDDAALTQTAFADETSIAGGVTFTTDSVWTATVADGTESAWLTIDPSSGDAAGEHTMNITLEPNTTGEDRTATITITSGETSISITVTQAATKKDGMIPVSGIMLRDTVLMLEAGQKDTLDVTVAPDDAGNKTVEWTSSNEAVATVNDAGVVSAVAEGRAVITATTNDGGFKDECAVTVNEAVKTMTLTTATSDYVGIRMTGTGAAVIDWGDGTAPDTVNLSTYGYRSHTFSDATSRTIVIKGNDITFLGCDDMKLTALDVSKNTALETLYCRGNIFYDFTNQLTSLDVSKNTALKELDCSHNPITSLDVSRNTGLTHLTCDSIQLTTLDVSKNMALTELNCRNNQLTTLDVTKNTALTVLDCSSNQLTNLDVTNNTKLTELYCRDNEFAAAGLNALFGTLQENAGYKHISIWGNPGTTECDKSIAEEKGWTVW